MSENIAISLAGSGSGAGGTTAASTVGAIGDDYAELVAQGSNAFAASGAKTLYLEAGDLSLASPAQIGNVINGVTVTAAMVDENQQLLDDIATYCKANGIGVTIEAQLDNPPAGDWTYQWLAPAEQAGLPITEVDGDDEIEFEHPVSDFANVAANEVAIVKQIASYYPDVKIGQWEGVGPTSTTQQWLSAYDSAATAAGLPQITTLVEDTTWFAPWEIAPSVNQSWELALSTLAAQDHLNLDVLLDGAETDNSGAQWVAQSEQDAASLAENTGAQVNGLQIQTWWPYPESVLPNNQDSTLSNDAEEIAATFSLYQAGLITAQSAIAINAPAQDVIAVGKPASLSSVSLQWNSNDVAEGARAAVVITDETGLLSVTDSGSASVTGSGTNELVIDGNAADIATVLASLKVAEPGVGPDVIDIEAFGSSGRLADAQVTVLAVPSPTAAAGQTIALPTGGTGQTWTAATATVGGNGALSQLSFTWPTSNVNASGAYVVTQEIGIHAPLTEQGVAYVNGVLEAPAANQAGGAPINLQGWAPAGAYDPASTTLTVSLTSTVMSYGNASGKLEQTTSSIAPFSAGSNPSIASLGNYLSTGGQQVTEYNTGDNPNWNPDWSSLLASVTTTYGSAGQVLEQVFQGGSSEAWFSLDNVYDPATGKLWEQIQTASPMGQYGSFASGPVFITQFNTGDNPNWDQADWGSASQVTTGWQDTYEVEVTTTAPVLTGTTLTAAYNMTGGAVPTPTTAGTASAVSYSGGLTLFGGQNAANITTGGNSILYLPAVGPAETVNSAGSDSIWVGGAPTTITNTGETDSLLAQGATMTLGGTSFNLSGSANAVTLQGSTTLSLSSATDSVTFGGSGDILTLGNAGTVTVTGDSGQVNLNGTAAVATIGDGDSININGAGDFTTAGNNASVFVNAAGATLYAGDTLQAWTTGANQVVTAGSHATVDEVGNADVLHLGNYGVVWMNGNGETADLLANAALNTYGTGDIGITSTNANTWVAGANNQVTIGDNSTAAVVGNSDTLTATNGSTIVITGTLDTVNLSGTADTVSSYASTSVAVNGSGSGVSVGQNASATIYGSNDTVTAASGDTVILVGNGNNLTTAAKSVVTLGGQNSSASLGDNSTIWVVTNQNTVAAQSGSTVDLYGSNDVAVAGSSTNAWLAGSGDVFTIGTGSIATAIGTNDTIIANAGSASITLHGTNDIGTGGDNVKAWEIGAGGTLTLGAAATVDMAGANTTATLGSGAVVWMYGANDVVKAQAGAIIDSYASGDVAVAGVGSQAWEAGTGNQITLGDKSLACVVASNNTVTVGNSSRVSVMSDNDVATIGAGSVANATGNADTIIANAGTVSMALYGSNDVGSGGDHVTAWEVGAAGTLTLGAAATDDLSGIAATATMGNGAVVWMNGANETVHAQAGATIDSYGSVDVASGGANSHAWEAGSSDQIVLGDNSVACVVANSNTVTTGANSSVVATSNNDLITIGSGGVDVTQGQQDTISFLTAGGTDTIRGFNAAAGDKLDLTHLLSGDQVAADLSTLASYVSLQRSGSNDILTTTGMSGQTHITLIGAGSITIPGLETRHALLFQS
jgi:hypothetical protein